MSIKSLMSVADAAGYAMAAPDDLPSVDEETKALTKTPSEALRAGIGKALTAANESKTRKSWMPAWFGGHMPA
jgi:hypothetical protein